VLFSAFPAALSPTAVRESKTRETAGWSYKTIDDRPALSMGGCAAGAIDCFSAIGKSRATTLILLLLF